MSRWNARFIYYGAVNFLARLRYVYVYMQTSISIDVTQAYLFARGRNQVVIIPSIILVRSFSGIYLTRSRVGFVNEDTWLEFL